MTFSFSVPMLISSSSAENRILSPSALLTSNLWHWASTISEPVIVAGRDWASASTFRWTLRAYERNRLDNVAIHSFSSDHQSLNDQRYCQLCYFVMLKHKQFKSWQVINRNTGNINVTLQVCDSTLCLCKKNPTEETFTIYYYLSDWH